MSGLIAVEEAKARIERSLPAPGIESCALSRAGGRILAEAVAARADQPPFDNSAMDGYAVRGAEISPASAGSPVVLRLAGEIAAGCERWPSLPPESCLRIFTGAPLPPGADGVVPVEETEALDGRVRFRAPLAAPGVHVRRAGEDLRAGDLLLPAGRRLDAPAMALLASQGVSVLPVRPRPRVSFLATGDELVDPGERPGPGRIRNSNGPMLAAQLQKLGVELLDFGFVGDEPDALRARLAEALSSGDVLITSGGVSAGLHDRVGELLIELGAEWIFHKVAQQPAKPLGFLLWRGRPVFALPGNPVSSFTAAWFYAIPALKRMMGDPDPEPRRYRARLVGSLRGHPDKLLFIRAWTRWEDGAFLSEPRPPHGSHVLSSLARANSFLLLPPGSGELAPGALLEVAFFEDSPA